MDIPEMRRMPEKAIKQFLSSRTIAVAGASNQRGKFGYLAYRELKVRGFSLYPVHPDKTNIDGDCCVSSIDALPNSVSRLLIILPPYLTLKLVKGLNPAIMRHVWLQPGSEGDEAIRICEEKGIHAISGECILMHAPPVRSYHLLHRCWRLATCARIKSNAGA